MRIGQIYIKEGSLFLRGLDGSEQSMPLQDALELLDWLQKHKDEIQEAKANTGLYEGLYPQERPQLSEAERYNLEMEARNRAVEENRDKPWLPFHDGE